MKSLRKDHHVIPVMPIQLVKIKLPNSSMCGRPGAFNTAGSTHGHNYSGKQFDTVL